MTPLPLEELKSKYVAGETLKALAKEYGCSQPTISKALRGAGVELRKPGRKKKEKQPLFTVQTFTPIIGTNVYNKGEE